MVGRSVCRLIPCVAMLAMLYAAACQPGGGLTGGVTCYPQANGTQACFNASGQQVTCDASGQCTVITVGGTTTAGTTTSGGGTTTGGNPNLQNPNFNQNYTFNGNCTCTPVTGPATDVNADNDGDCVPNAAETLAGTNPNVVDTDGDGLRDGCEDTNHDGVYQYGLETDPLNADTDCDGLWDGNIGAGPVPTRASVLSVVATRYASAAAGSFAASTSWSCYPYASGAANYGAVNSTYPYNCGQVQSAPCFPDGTRGGEDSNNNGLKDPGETNPRTIDSDGDGIADGLEDINLNGAVDGGAMTNTQPCTVQTNGESDPRKTDTDGDGIGDGVEVKVSSNTTGQYNPNPNGLLTETAPWAVDTDCDGLPDGVEDLNHNGIQDNGETNPRSVDSDGDGLCDGKEDINHNGKWDKPSTTSAGETSPLVYDSDGDGIPDGVENKDPNNVNCAGPQGNYNPYSNPTVCWGGAAGVRTGSDPRLADTDGDGIKDGVEDVNQNGNCDIAMAPNPVNPNQLIVTYTETCAFQTDTDCDGLTDSQEDKNRNGVVDGGETDPRNKDSDYDGLQDGCVPANSNTPPGCEDKNDSGYQDPNETDPTNPDSDGDLLSDSCELNFKPDSGFGGVSGPTNPLSIDTDGDGMADGDEDANHNCQTDAGETDPRHYDAPPQATDPNFPRYAVCATSNLNAVTFAEDLRSYADVRIAFEAEQAPAADTCPGYKNSECAAGEVCVAGQCNLQAQYIVQAFGQDNDGGGFNEQDQNDTLWGWTFQSPTGVNVDTATSTTLNRDIYGFVQLAEDNRQLDDILDSVRNSFGTTFTNATVTQTGALPSRSAFDSTTSHPVNFAQRQFTFSFQFTNSYSTLGLRNAIMLNQFFRGYTPSPMPPVVDPVYGNISCPSNTNKCFLNFTLYMTAVQRPTQIGPSGNPVVILVLALTENDTVGKQPTDPVNRFYPDRITRLQDLTGGSAVAHYNAAVGKNCDQLPQKQAVADLLWVVDDSRSMQQLISRLQQAAVAAQTILTSNSSIVNYRIGMTTTNPSPTMGTLCPSYCDQSCAGNGNSFTLPGGTNTDSFWCNAGCADVALGCIKQCPPSCVENTVNPNGFTTCSSCNYPDVCAQCPNNPNSCTPAGNPGGNAAYLACADGTNPSNLATAIAADGYLNNRWLVGGGGHFYSEDNWGWDCDSYTYWQGGATSAQYNFINPCYDPNYGSSNGMISSFYGGGSVRDTNSMRSNAGMIGSDPNVVLGLVPACNTTLLDLNATTSGDGTCTPGSPGCCGRLTNVCDDGATVFASQMCDVIRAMGGLPVTLPSGSKTSGARRHSAPEEGSRSARRLLQRMIPAYPFDSTDPNAKTHLRLTCSSTDPNCVPCDPTLSSTCQIVPLATVFLSDEEDFYFKDDCSPYLGTNPNAPPTQNPFYGAADSSQLFPTECIWLDGNPNTTEPCTYNYCHNLANLQYGVPTGVNHDQAAWTTDAYYTVQWPSSTPAQCGATATSCVADPCPLLDSACTNASTLFPNAHCVASSGKCVNHCSAIVQPQANGPTDANTMRTQCEADPLCYWDQSQIYASPPATYLGACRMAQPFNDCQACKRFERLYETVNGTDANNVPTGLVGIGQVGPAYAITRNKGQPGYGTWLGDSALSPSQDTCGGGTITWGRGDGQAYRDIATATLGRIQDVCSRDYTDFVQLLVSDLAILSKPYPLTQKPIATTIKVGISRLASTNPNTYTYIPVPRSQTSGFFYDATGNTIGFKSDPVDGQCGNTNNCAADGNITAAEIVYAENANFIPRSGDTVYVSYRTWQPVPCGGACPSGEICAEVMCVSGLGGTSCPAAGPNADAYCAPGYTCQAGMCTQTCTANTLVNACVNNAECGPCQDFNHTTLKCENISGLNSTCVCNPNSTAIPCNPAGANTCPISYTCDESCVCLEAVTCPGVTYNTDNTVSCPTLSASACGQAAVACCPETICPQHSTQSSCNGDTTNHCAWLGTAGNGVCEVGGGGCCNLGSTPSYFIDPELGTVSIACQPAACECCCQDTNAYPNGWGSAVPQCDPAAPGPGTMCSDKRAACGCYINGG